MGKNNHPAGRASRGGNPYLPHSQRDDSNVVPFQRRGAPPIQTRRGVPVGTSVLILAWVDGDPERASRALEQEQAQEKPRVTLVKELTATIRRATQRALEATEQDPQLQLAPEG